MTKHEKISDLMEKRMVLVDQLWEAANKEDKQVLNTLKSELRSLDEKINIARMLDDADRADPGTPIHGDAKLSSEIRSKFSLARAIAFKAGIDGVDAGFEREVQSELAKRAGKPPKGFYVPTEIFETRVNTTGSAAAIVPTDFRTDLMINALAAATVIRGMGATVLTGLRGDVAIPRETGSPAVAWVGENSSLSYSDASFDSVTLSPHHVGALSEFTRDMIMQSSPEIEGILRKMLARNIAQAIDKAAIRGGGSNEPVGILATEGIQTVTGDTDLFTACADAVALADIANVDASRAFLTNNVVKKIASKSLDGQNRPTGIANIFGNERVVFTNLAVNDGNSPANNPLIYGDFSELVLGIWSELDILVNPFSTTAFEKMNVIVRAAATVDVAVRHPAAFVSVVGVTNTFAAMPALS